MSDKHLRDLFPTWQIPEALSFLSNPESCFTTYVRTGSRPKATERYLRPTLDRGVECLSFPATGWVNIPMPRMNFEESELFLFEALRISAGAPLDTYEEDFPRSGLRVVNSERFAFVPEGINYVVESNAARVYITDPESRFGFWLRADAVKAYRLVPSRRGRTWFERLLDSDE